MDILPSTAKLVKQVTFSQTMTNSGGNITYLLQMRVDCVSVLHVVLRGGFSKKTRGTEHVGYARLLGTPPREGADRST